jgi:hypothetical protein
MEGIMPIKETNEERWKDLPLCVCLNTTRAGMFDDTEVSGLYLKQGGGTDEAGTEVKSWGHVPKTNNCIRIQRALNFNILLPCKPGGISTKLPTPEFKGKMQELMARSVKELTPIIDQAIDIELLKVMKAFEDSKSKKEKRLIVIAELTRRINRLSNVSPVKQNYNFIKDSQGNMVKDVIKLK